MTIAGVSLLQGLVSARHAAVAVEPLLVGLPLTEAALRAGRAWVDWTEARVVYDRLGAALEHDDAHLAEIATREIATHPIHRMIAPLVAEPSAWIATYWRIEAALHPALEIVHRVDSSGHAVVARLRRGRAPCRTWFQLMHVRGAAAMLPVGGTPLQTLDVNATETSLAARYANPIEIPSDDRRKRQPRVALSVVLASLASLGDVFDPATLDGNLASDPSSKRAPPEHVLLAEQWQLTPAEARTAIALAEGLSPAQIAEVHGVTISTVRVHLKRAYAKTETAGQRELAERVRRWRVP